jgi:hypothetical protein
VARNESHVSVGGLSPILCKTQNWKKIVGRKNNTCEESIQGVHAEKPNHIRVRVFVGDFNG